MHDLRKHGDVRGLDKSGFDYVQNVPTGFKEWESDEKIVSSYYPETVRWVQQCSSTCSARQVGSSLTLVRSLIKDTLGASKVFMWVISLVRPDSAPYLRRSLPPPSFDHTIRRRVPDKDNVEDRAGRVRAASYTHSTLTGGVNIDTDIAPTSLPWCVMIHPPLVSRRRSNRLMNHTMTIA